MTDAHDMVHITQYEFEQFIGQDTRSIRKAKERMISEDSTQTHRSGMQDRFMA